MRGVNNVQMIYITFQYLSVKFIHVSTNVQTFEIVFLIQKFSFDMKQQWFSKT